ncbi:hypothetical protein [Novosphingobium decolorationis]|uniref:Serine/threonine protein kinase n=1 Tax=Novosphingobium decolorationis TaxID=2698673 RepID=A0ABX8EBV3_9SPHN|nr:hypothetical protein [Novosphingobium decolorationis]MED5544527.1 hypothetical protein [Pseudomonadota bacterium]QVM85476.1 hypothetical protein HT578_18800 [Novosphingobium decolorationis]
MKKFSGLMLLGCSALALAGCGADDIASPGAGSVVVNNGGGTPTPTPTPTTGIIEAAAECPTFNATGGLSNDGTIEDPNGNSWRICTLPALVDASSSLPNEAGVLYRINGRVDVGCDGGFSVPSSGSPYTTTTASCLNAGISSLTSDTSVELTIDPGVIVYAENAADPAWLAVNRGNTIQANGTASSPIVFTSRQNVVGSATDSSDRQWGGIVLLGRGIITDCTAGGSVATDDCQRETEGAATPATFGGRNNGYSAGSMRYVQIRYSGYNLAPDAELQSLTGGGLGTGTTLDYIQTVNSSDDGSEFFGGAVNMKHYIAVNADDDSLDTDTGLKGNFQYLLLLQRAGAGDAFFEIDSNNNINSDPADRQRSTFANFTAIQSGNRPDNSDEASILVRGDADINFVNGIINTPSNECIRVDGRTATGSATFTANSVVMTCGDTGPFLSTGSQYSGTNTAADMFNAGTNNNASITSTLTSTFVNGSNESGVVAYANIASFSSFFDVVDYIGAVRDANDTWYRGWTCDNATADFGTGSLCTGLPVA